jgi:hypothetical protein
MSSSRHTTQRHITNATRMTFRAIAFLCVCASLWRAPVPWFHFHDGLGPHGSLAEAADSGMTMLLNRHLESCHSDGETTESEWHLHVVMLDDIVRGHGCPVPPTGSEAPDEVFVPVTHVAPAEPSAVPVTLADAIPLPSVDLWQSDSMTVPDGLNVRALRRQFLSDHAESRRLLTVLCVSRC